MELHEGVADLHMHTTASDGTATVPERANQAADLGLSTIAITDHDLIDGSLEGRSIHTDDVELITGVEVRAGFRGTKIELLGYYVDPAADPLQTLLSEVRGYREERNREMVARLRERTGLEASFEELAGAVDGSLGRPHLAEKLIQAGEVENIGEAFDRYLGRDGAAYVEMKRADYERVVQAIHAAEGVASLAHPGRIAADATVVEDALDALTIAGLDGIEVWYPYDRTADDDRYADIDVARADRLATDYDLIRTGGSDCHGPDSGKDRIGQVRVPKDSLDRLRDAAGLS